MTPEGLFELAALAGRALCVGAGEATGSLSSESESDESDEDDEDDELDEEDELELEEAAATAG